MCVKSKIKINKLRSIPLRTFKFHMKLSPLQAVVKQQVVKLELDKL